MSDENHEKEANKEPSTEEIVHASNYVLNQLIDLLIEKKVISEKELVAKLDNEVSSEKDSSEVSSEKGKNVCNIGDKNCCC